MFLRYVYEVQKNLPSIVCMYNTVKVQRNRAVGCWCSEEKVECRIKD